MEVYLAIKRIPFEADTVLGVFETEEQAKQRIVDYLNIQVEKTQKTAEDLLFYLAADWCIDSYAVGHTANHGLILSVKIHQQKLLQLMEEA